MSLLPDTFSHEETGPPPDDSLNNATIHNAELWTNEGLHSMYLAELANHLVSLANAERYLGLLRVRLHAGDDSARRILRSLGLDDDNAPANEE